MNDDLNVIICNIQNKIDNDLRFIGVRRPLESDLIKVLKLIRAQGVNSPLAKNVIDVLGDYNV